MRLTTLYALFTLLGLALLATAGVSAQTASFRADDGLASLKTIRVPEPPNLGEFIQDRGAAIQLGKALFWDMQVGSDGVQACASCHFRAGADPRIKNQLSPGGVHIDEPGEPGFDGFQLGGPNYILQPGDFPFHLLKDPDDRDSTVLRDINDVASSQGVFLREFVDIDPGSPVEIGNVIPDPVFQIGLPVGGALRFVNTRRVEPRNTPTTINAAFNFHNFWDGRARNVFNGVNPFGEIDSRATVLRVNGRGEVESVRIRLENASLASQAVGPPLSDFEMSFRGRSFPRIGKKMLALRPLARQIVHPEDSTLGPLVVSRTGLGVSYAALIQKAFRREWWDSDKIVTFDAGENRSLSDLPPGQPRNTNQFTLMEANFSLFFGLAIQLYESTLIADDTPLDQYLEGKEAALTDQQKRGLEIFVGDKAKCINCHGGPELTNASVRNVVGERLERMIMGDGGEAVYDNGFYNIGVRPTREDLGRGGTFGGGPYGRSPDGVRFSPALPLPISDARLAQIGLFFDPNLNPPIRPDERVAVDGAFKTPGLRNVELTAPYFHNGGQATLRQVVEFYNRGADFARQNLADLDPDIAPIGLSEEEKQALVAFLQALTDQRVRWERAPFDHPQLLVPNGHLRRMYKQPPPTAEDEFLEIPAVGRNGDPTAPR